MTLLTLAAFSVAAGVLILLVFKTCSNQHALQAARRRVRGHLFAIRLFGDDPVTILRSQGGLLAWNARYLALLLPAFLVVAIPLFFSWDYLDAVWGRAPLAPGDTAVLTARLRGDAACAKLTVPAWMAVETPAVRILAEHEVSWRVRVLHAGSGWVKVDGGAASVEKRIEAKPGLHYLRDRTTAPAGIEWVEIRYPRTNVNVLGLSVNWVVLFCAISTLTALALRRRLRVTF